MLVDDESAEFSLIDDCLFMPLEDDDWRGLEAGGDARDAYMDAINWWEEQFDWIESELSR